MGKKNYYEVEYITKMKIEDGKRLFRVKWVGFPSNQNTWEPEQHLSQTMIDSYLKEKEIRENERKKRVITRGQPKSDKFEMRIVEMRLKQGRQNEYEFAISTGNKREVVERSYLYRHFPTKLAKFYLGLYMERNKKSELSCSQ